MTAETAPLRTLIVDDEPLAIERLQILCAGEPQIALVGTASDGEAALRLIEALTPDLVLLDISMPGLDGMDVARAVDGKAAAPAIIFCTAFDHYAVAAFDVAAVGYLLKPVTPDQLAKAVKRVARVRSEAAAEAEAVPDYLDEFWVTQRSEVIRIAATDIDRIEAERDYMRLHVGQRSFLLHQTISELERRLDPAKFLRLHRSTIVRRDAIAKMRHNGLGTWFACLTDGTELRIGRSYQTAAKAAAKL
ncbi:two-component system response regulator AlgR [Sphingomonas vulcanisoli]|uniref:Two-component system response regulator AlgR n=1 Tax=Sphingomonas vulcanisoli TaxID=1658060 RepID=A0ABX0TPV4_9SPHN|nr:LytTR family DNA-binding domain-containing protein [Sphingomonas vulcanisoli]NIJ06794.1 two-component system response regulator AlgR [Sphingomonas vulcanisoli]